MFAVTVGLLLPLSMIDSINQLRFASLFGVSCILYMIVVVFYIFSREGMSPTLGGLRVIEPKCGIEGVVRMSTLAVFAYCCQPNIPSIYVELEKRSFRRMDKVSVRAMILCFFIYVLMGISGFLAFGDDTSTNIIQNLRSRVRYDPVVMVGFAGMTCAVILAFPLNIFPIRYCVETICVFHWEALENHRAKLRVGITTFVVLMAWISAVLIPSLSTVFSLVGAFSGSVVCYIAPAMFIIKVVPGPIFRGYRAKAIVLFAVGLLFLIVGTASAIQDVVSPRRRDWKC